MHIADTTSGLIRRARVLRRVIVFAAVLSAAVTVWALLPAAGGSGYAVSAALDTGGLPVRWAAGLAVVMASLTCAALIELARMLGHVGRGAMFPAAATKHFRRFAWLLLAAAFANAFLPAAVMLALSFAQNRPSVAIDFDAADFLILLLAAVFYWVSALFDEAARLEEENRSIV